MADERIEIEVVPTVAHTTLASLKRAFAGVMPQVGGAGAGAGPAVGGLVGSAGAGALVAGGAGVALAGLQLAFEGIHKFMENAVGFVGKANPAVVERLALAFDDVQAVIGHALTPVIELFTDAIRLLGDFLATLLPSTENVRDALAPLRDMMDSVRNYLGGLAQALKPLLDFLLKLVPVLFQIAKWSTVMWWWPFALANAVHPNQGQNLKSSFGASASQVGFSGATELRNRMIQATLAAGVRTNEERIRDAVEKTAGSAASIDQKTPMRDGSRADAGVAGARKG